MVAGGCSVRAGGLFGQARGHAAVHEVHDLFADRRLAGGGRGRLHLGLREGLEGLVADALRLVAPVDHHLARELDGLGLRGVEEQHRGRGARVEALLAHAPQQVAHRPAIELEHAESVTPGKQFVGCRVVERQMIQVQIDTAIGLDVIQCVPDDGEVAQAQEVHLQQARFFNRRTFPLRDDVRLPRDRL